MKPDFSREKRYWRKGFLVLGIDEVGRGALVGPVVAAAVAFFKNPPIGEFFKKEERWWQEKGLNDSKLLSPGKREELAKLIKKVSLSWGIGQATAGEIDRKGIVWATQKAMRQAVARATKRLELKADRQLFLLIDAFHIKYVPGIGLKNQRAIIKGDQRSLSIAAASILAKVYRDRLMVRLANKYPFYRRFNWEQNKGYGTRAHWQAILRWGVSRYHRKSYLKRIKLQKK